MTGRGQAVPSRLRAASPEPERLARGPQSLASHLGQPRHTQGAGGQGNGVAGR